MSFKIANIADIVGTQNYELDKIKIFTEKQPSTVELETIQCNILLQTITQ